MQKFNKTVSLKVVSLHAVKNKCKKIFCGNTRVSRNVENIKNVNKN